MAARLRFEMVMRAIWSGHVTFGLITIPVGVHAALEAAERVSFRLLHRKDHAPIEYKKFCSLEKKSPAARRTAANAPRARRSPAHERAGAA